MRALVLASAAIAALSLIAPNPLFAMPAAASVGKDVSAIKKAQYYYRPNFYRPYYYRGYGYPYYYRPYGSCWGCGWPYGG
jgi:hypothetical protein